MRSRIRSSHFSQCKFVNVIKLSPLPKQNYLHVFVIFFYINLYFSTNQRTNGPVNAHLISWPSKTQNIKKQENIW